MVIFFQNVAPKTILIFAIFFVPNVRARCTVPLRVCHIFVYFTQVVFSRAIDNDPYVHYSSKSVGAAISRPRHANLSFVLPTLRFLHLGSMWASTPTVFILQAIDGKGTVHLCYIFITYRGRLIIAPTFLFYWFFRWFSLPSRIFFIRRFYLLQNNQISLKFATDI